MTSIEDRLGPQAKRLLRTAAVGQTDRAAVAPANPIAAPRPVRPTKSDRARARRQRSLARRLDAAECRADCLSILVALGPESPIARAEAAQGREAILRHARAAQSAGSLAKRGRDLERRLANST